GGGSGDLGRWRLVLRPGGGGRGAAGVRMGADVRAEAVAADRNRGGPGPGRGGDRRPRRPDFPGPGADGVRSAGGGFVRPDARRVSARYGLWGALPRLALHPVDLAARPA